MNDQSQLAAELVARIRQYERCIVAFSGGVDSVVVAKAAQLALGERATAVTAVSPSLAGGELEAARAVAETIGIDHRTIKTAEFANPDYTRNAPDRCYHCKSELYERLQQLRDEFPNTIIANGTNTDDLGDYRPGLQAAAENQVRSPLAECGLNKQAVRDLAKHWDLPVWNKPAAPCLSSRIAYGESVTPERLRMIDQAEQFLRSCGFEELRVRYHPGDLARVEVPLNQLPQLTQEPLRSELTARLREYGFRFVTIDASGFQSGNLNSLVPVDVLKSSINR